MDEQRRVRKPQVIQITLSEVDPADDPRYIEVVHETITIGIRIGGEPWIVECPRPLHEAMALEALETSARLEAAVALEQANAATPSVSAPVVKPTASEETLVAKARKTLIDHVATGTKEGVKWAVRILVSLATGS